MGYSCKHVSHMVSETYERRLSLIERIGLHVHLWLCAACRHSKKDMDCIHTIFQKMRQQESDMPNIMSDKDRERIRNKLHHLTE